MSCFEKVSFGFERNKIIFEKKHLLMQEMSAKTNALNWFNIPMTDEARPKQFY
jgi:hypothetical protein